MENPNAMALNGGGMPANMTGMQRPQRGNIQQQLHAQALTDLQLPQSQVTGGWQMAVDIRQRAVGVMQLITALRLLRTDMSELKQCYQLALSWEMRSFRMAPNKEAYMDMIQQKLHEIKMKRESQAAAGQMNMNTTNNMGMPPNNNNNNNGNNNNNMSGGGFGGMNVQAMGMQNGGMNMPNAPMSTPNLGQPMAGFPGQQMQRPMQVSPIPPQQRPAPPNNNLNNDNTGNNNNNNNLSAPQNMAGPPQIPGGLPPPSDPQVQSVLRQTFASMSEEKKRSLRQAALGRMSEQERAATLTANRDPLLPLLVNNARTIVARQRQQQGRPQPNNGGGAMQMGNQQGMMGGGNMSQQQQQQQQQPGGPNMDFILGQQANALKQQESGEQVVPASNNAASFGGVNGQMNMGGQGINPQMLGGANNPAVNQQQLHTQMQELLVQQQKQQEAQRQSRFAQQQAMQQQQQRNVTSHLQGQPGGLNAPNALNGGPAGPMHSPAMSMLNRPMVPPGEAAPATPQQPNRPPNQTPRPQMNNATQNLMQQHQQMTQNGVPLMNLNVGAVSPNSMNPMDFMRRQQELQEITRGLPQHVVEMIMSRNPDPLQARAVVEQVKVRMQNQSQNQNQNQHPPQQGGLMMNGRPGGQPQPGMGAQLPPHMNRPQMGSGLQPNAMFGGIPGQGMQPGGMPGFNPQQPSQGPSDMDAVQLQQRQQRQQAMRQQAMDLRPFDRSLLQNLGIQVPAHISAWGELKNHVAKAQQVLPPNMMQRVQQRQQQWFLTHPDDMSAAVSEFRQRYQNSQQRAQQLPPQQQPAPPSSGPSSGSLPNGGQAPPAQMVPPTAPIKQPGPNQRGSGILQGVNRGQTSRLSQPHLPRMPSLEEAKAMKDRMEPNFRGSIEQFRQFVFQKQKEKYASQLQTSQQQAQQQALHMVQAQRQGQGAPDGQQLKGQSRPPQQAPQVNQGQKRAAQPQSAATDDVVEIPDPHGPSQQTLQGGAPQAPPMQGAKSQQQQGIPALHGAKPQIQETLMNMTPEERGRAMGMLHQRQREVALTKAQMGVSNTQTTPQGPQVATGQQQLQPQPRPPPRPQGSSGMNQPPRPDAEQQKPVDKMRAMYAEIQQTTPKGPPVQLSQQDLIQAQVWLKRLWNAVGRIPSTFARALQEPRMEGQVKNMMKVHMQVMQNVADSNGTIKDYLSLTPQRMQEMYAFCASYLEGLKRMQTDSRKPGGQQQPSQNGNVPQAVQQPQRPVKGRTASAASKAPPPSAQPPPAQAMNRTASQRGQNKKASASSKAPPAPTENKTFEWGASSPHGVPKYESSRSDFTQDKLKIPPNKKRRTGQGDSQTSPPTTQTGTPGAATASPRTGPRAGPSGLEQQTKKEPPQIKQETAAREPEDKPEPAAKCDDALCQWNITGFATPAEAAQHKCAEHDHVADPLAFLLESNTDPLGHYSKPVAAEKDVKQDATPISVVKSQTPSVKQEFATPPGAIRPSAPLAPAAAPPGAVPSEKTLREDLEEKVGFEPSTKPSVPADTAPSTALQDPDEQLFSEMLQTTLCGADGIDENFDFGDVDVGDLRPEFDSSSPELTPSEGTSQSSRESDISQTERLRINLQWDAFGETDGAIPEAMKHITLGSEMSGMHTLGLDGSPVQPATTAILPDADSKQALNADDDWDWTKDTVMDWDSMFGPDAGHELGQEMTF